MKPTQFEEALHKAVDIVRQKRGVVLVSLGCKMYGKKFSLDKVYTQQAPRSLLSLSPKPVVLILVDPLFLGSDPDVLSVFDEYHVWDSGKQLKPMEFPHVTMFKCGQFLTEEQLLTGSLVNTIRSNPHVKFYIGDFTVNHPCSPFSEFEKLKNTIVNLPNVLTNRECVQDVYV